MNHRYAHSPLARALAGAALAASIVGAASPASAATCTFDFPTTPTRLCAQGSSSALVGHVLVSTRTGTKFQVSINMTGGTIFAAAFGIDVNGNQLNTCATTAADDNPNPAANARRGVACSRLYGTAGTAQPTTEYNYPLNMRSTFLVVL